MEFIAETEKLISAFSREIVDWDVLERTYFGDFLHNMKEVAQNPRYHGEGDVFTHTNLVCREMIRQEEFSKLSRIGKTELFAAALLHDIGKIKTTRMEEENWISPNHSKVGSMMAREFLWKECGLCGTREKQQLRETICGLIRYHMMPVHMVDLNDPEQKVRLVAAAGEPVPDFSWKLLCMLAEADTKGRIAPDLEEELEKLQLCRIIAEEADCFDGPYHFPDSYTKRAYFSGRRVVPDQPLYDNTWGEIVLMSGLPGTGKDTWIRNHLSHLPMISLDEIRKEKKIKPVEPQGKVLMEAQERAKVFLRKHQPFVWNATNLTPDTRQKQISLFERYGAGVRIVYLETEWEMQMERNGSRREEVPVEAVEKMLGKLTPPMPEEAGKVEWYCV